MKSKRKLVDFSWYRADKKRDIVGLKREAEDLIKLLNEFLVEEITNWELEAQLIKLHTEFSIFNGKELAIKELLSANNKKL